MNYTINGKEYSEFDINKRCAELEGLIVKTEFQEKVGFTKSFHEKYPNTVWAAKVDEFGNQTEAWEQMVFTRCPSDTWLIIEKCWDDLMDVECGSYSIKWVDLMEKHNCTKLVAACICFIEINEGKQ